MSNFENEDEEYQASQRLKRKIIIGTSIVLILMLVLPLLGINSSFLVFTVLISAAILLFNKTRKQAMQNNDEESEREDNFIDRMNNMFGSNIQKNSNDIKVKNVPEEKKLSKQDDEVWNNIVSNLSEEEFDTIHFGNIKNVFKKKK